jgi:hypothetical protein
MKFASDKTMFQIYRESDGNEKIAVVYFTALNEHNREGEINRALAGEHVFDGFLRDDAIKDAKKHVDALIKEMNDGNDFDPDAIRARLKDYLV